MSKNINKPLVIKLREAKTNILESVNAAIRSGIPCYLLESIVADIHREVSKGAETEYEQAVKRQTEEAKEEATNGS